MTPAPGIGAIAGGPPPWLMGILNVTPDSFSDGGLFLDPAAAEAQGRRLLAEGAHLVDIGGESTAPGRPVLAAEDELFRILPVVQALAQVVPLSIDTYHAATADRCLALGAQVVNDVSALRADPAMAGVVRAHGAVLVLIHAKDGPLPHATALPRHFDDVVGEVADFLLGRAEAALAAGIAEAQIVLDPGMGGFLSLEAKRLLAAAGGVLAAGRAATALSGDGRGARARAFSACRGPSGTHYRSSRPWSPSAAAPRWCGPTTCG